MRKPSRRAVAAGLAAAGAAAAVGVYAMSGDGGYDALAAEQARPARPDGDTLELVRLATLAANSHNTQPWRFRIAAGAIDILPDPARRTPVVDPDDHHLHVSLGCAAENLAIAARAGGKSGEVTAGEGGAVRVSLAAGPADTSPLFAAIPARQCSRATYDGRTVAPDILARLEAAARVEGVEPVIVADGAQKEKVLDLITAGNSAQLDDRAFVAELKSWLRFNKKMAAASRDGLFGPASGNPSLPGWLGPIMFDFAFTKDGENKKLAEQVRSSPTLIAFAGPSDDPAGWVAAGRACQRFALQATADGLRHAFVNQPVEVPAERRELQALLGLGGRRADLLIRFGHGPAMPRSLRRDVRDVIVQA